MHIIVVAGGNSPEREISLQSGKQVYEALCQRGHDVQFVDAAEIDWESFSCPDETVLMLTVHGEFGEDGTLQAILEKKQIRYTGSNSTASGLAFQKSLAKQRFREAQLQTPPSVLLNHSDRTAYSPCRLQESLGPFPWFVKPDAGGSSIATSAVHSEQELQSALDQCWAISNSVLIEKLIVGREFTVAVFKDQALPPVEIVVTRSFYDFTAKYADSGTVYVTEPQINEELKQQLEHSALVAHQCLGASGLTRSDFILDEMGAIWILELNTLPGMTPRSLAPKAAQKAGWSFAELCEAICEAALESE